MSAELDTCGCCRSTIPDVTVFNRPALPALVYRAGTHSSFTRRMTARLPREIVQGGPSLAGLTTRSPLDFSIALIDAWATAADVLTFYQERIANEGFLRTAVERPSVLELARTIGYELRPGVAASTHLVFTVEDAPDAPPGDATLRGEADARSVVVPAGTRVDSMPSQDQLPRPFETTADTVVSADWNALRPRLTQPQIVALGGTNNSLPHLVDEHGNPLLLDPKGRRRQLERLYVAGVAGEMSSGDRLLIATKPAGTVNTRQVLVRAVEAEPELQRTRVDLDVGIDALPPAPLPMPQFTLLPFAQIALSKVMLTKATIGTQIVGQRWTENSLGVQLSIQGWHIAAMLKFIAQPPPPPPRLPAPKEGVFRFHDRLGFFGNSAQDSSTLPDPANLEQGSAAFPNKWDSGAGWKVWSDPKIATADPQPWADADAYLERTVPDVLQGSWVLFDDGTKWDTYRVGSVLERSVTGFNLSAKSTGLNLRTANDGDVSQPDYAVRKTTAHVGSELLELADLPIEEPVAAGATEIELDGMVLGLESGRALAISGERADLPGVIGNEIATLERADHQGGRTILFLHDALEFAYVRNKMKISANVAAATHGQTMSEVLGSGDGSLAYQRFTLNKPELTHVAAATPTGAQSTLQLHVGGIRWEEARALYGLDSRAESYIVRIDDERKATVITGDGRTGARLPTGLENVKAVYRSGIGFAGHVAADALTLIPKRPFGVRSVTNPLPPNGAAEPEARDAARDNAPLTVLTLDRIVSVQDYEDFARAFAGVGKAQAVPFWSGEHQLAHVTIAAANGDEVLEDSALCQSLVAAIEGARDPGQLFEVHSYDRRYFNAKARLELDGRRIADDALAAANAALVEAFHWEQRAFGQPVSAAEVVAVLMSVDGVVATAIEELYVLIADGAPETPYSPLLPAARAALVPPTQAELLLINPAGIDLREVPAA